MHFQDLILPQHVEFVRNQIKLALSKRTSFKFEYQIIGSDGILIWVEEFGDAIYKDNNII